MTTTATTNSTVPAAVYEAVAEWLLYPEEVDLGTLESERFDQIVATAGEVGPDIAANLGRFKDGWGTLSEEEYLNLFELNPRCPLYLGSHQFEEPTSCATAGLSDRNTYMLEIGNIYRHFGFQLKGEMPDYLPAMVEFLALTADCEGEDRDVRMRLVVLLMVDGVRLVNEKLENEKGPYHHLLEALQRCLRREMEDYPKTETLLKSGQSQEQAQQLIQIEGVLAK